MQDRAREKQRLATKAPDVRAKLDIIVRVCSLLTAHRERTVTGCEIYNLLCDVFRATYYVTKIFCKFGGEEGEGLGSRLGLHGSFALRSSGNAQDMP